MAGDDLDPHEREALDAWIVPPPDEGFADRVVRAWSNEPRRRPWWSRLRGPWGVVLLAGICGGALAAVTWRPTEAIDPPRTIAAREPGAGTPVRHADTLADDIAALVAAHGRNFGPAFRFAGVVRVRRGDEVLFERGFGTLTPAGDLPIAADASFALGSLTQILTAAEVLRLAEQGRLGLDDPLRNHGGDRDVDPRVRLRDLLRHTSGLVDEPAGARRRNPAGVPGERFVPSHENYRRLADVIEHVTGAPWTRAVETTLRAAGVVGLDPANAPDEDAVTGGTWTEDEVLEPRRPTPTPACRGTCGAWGTARALDGLVTALRSGRIVAAETVARELIRRGPAGTAGMLAWTQGGHAVIGASGGQEGYNAAVLHDRDEDLAIVVLAATDLIDARVIAADVLDLCHGEQVQAPEEPEEIAIPPEVLLAHVGHYVLADARVEGEERPTTDFASEPVASVDVVADGDRLRFVVPGWGRKWMHPEGPHEFFFKDLPRTQAWFVTDASDRIVALRVRAGSLELGYRRDGDPGTTDAEARANPREHEMMSPQLTAALAASLAPDGFDPQRVLARANEHTAKVHSVVESYREEVRGCFARDRGPRAAAVVALDLVIAPDGTVVDSRVRWPDASNASIGPCLAGLVKHWRVPGITTKEPLKVVHRFERARFEHGVEMPIVHPESTGEIDRDVIRRIVKAHRNEIRYCHDQGLLRQPGLSGRVVVRFAIGHAGSVTAAELEDTTVPDGEVAACCLRALRRWKFPRPRGGDRVVVSVPFSLEPSATEPSNTAPASLLPEKLDQASVRAGLAPVLDRAQSCGAKHGATSGEKVRVSLSIEGATGRVTAAKAELPHAATPLGTCVAAAVAGAVFPRFQAPSLGVVYPVVM